MPDFPDADDAPPLPPPRPDDEECCHSGCNPCVFDIYEEEMERYRARLQAWQQRRAEAGQTKAQSSKKNR